MPGHRPRCRARTPLGARGRIAHTPRVSAELDPSQIYRPPVAASTEAAPPSRAATFHVVSIGKLVALFIVTLGIYQIYWFYKHWQGYQAITGEKVRPFWRAVFSVFFVHKLFAAISAHASSHSSVEPWKHNTVANVFVVLTIVAAVMSRISNAATDMSVFDWLAIVVGLFAVLPLRTAQKMANIAAGDPEGASNSRYGMAAIVALFFGGLCWLMLVASVILSVALPH
jgi:hypothetical protein